MALDTRFLDLLELLRAYYYHPDFHGSFSIKFVLPVLVPEAGYSDLDIREGSQASLAFAQVIAPEAGEDEREGIGKRCSPTASAIPRRWCGSSTPSADVPSC